MIEKQLLQDIIAERLPILQKRMGLSDWYAEFKIVPERDFPGSSDCCTRLYTSLELRSLKFLFNENYWVFYDYDDIDFATAISHSIVHELVHKWLMMKDEFKDNKLWEEQFCNVMANAVLDIHFF